MQYEPSDDPKVFILKARGELQVAIVFEEIRRAGFELMISRPQVLMQEGENGEQLEPFENVVFDGGVLCCLFLVVCSWFLVLGSWFLVLGSHASERCRTFCLLRSSWTDKEVIV